MNPEEKLALLRRFEPVLKFTKGEQFFPMPVEDYINACSLWVHQPNRFPRRLWEEHEVDFHKMTEPIAYGEDAVFYLKFIEPLKLSEIASYRIRDATTKSDAEKFQAGSGRLARVGYASRIIDALFSLSLFARGRIPGDTALAAAQSYQQIFSRNPCYTYYGRVVEENDWIALQYWYFYPFNNWRSGYHGANDHEADWEMVYVYLYRTDSDYQPEWVAYASHDFEGDDLRRHWRDPEVEKVGEHPIVYVGAGSHASYFHAGEYLTEIELPFVGGFTRLISRLQEFWEEKVLSFPPGSSRERWAKLGLFRVPFIDYARGDGVAVGLPDGQAWSDPTLLEPVPDWVAQFRGLWGLYAQDPLSGEDAPAGPMYNRDGTVRRSWYDPLGWSGLDKVPAPSHRSEYIDSRLTSLKEVDAGLDAEIATLNDELVAVGVDLAAMKGHPHFSEKQQAYDIRLAEISNKLTNVRRQHADNALLIEALERYQNEDGVLEMPALRSHINRNHIATSPDELSVNRFVELWSAISIGILMIGLVVLGVFARSYLLVGIIALIAAIVVIEASFRRRMAGLVSLFTNIMAFFAGIILFYEFFWQTIVVLLLIAGSYIIWQNLSELRK